VKLTRLEIKLLAPSVNRDPVPIFTLETKPLTTSKPYEGETPSQPPLETPSGTIDTTRNITKEQDSSAVKQPASDSSSNPATRERIKAYGAEGQPCVFCGKPGGSIRLRNEKILYAHDECMSKDYGGA
jgi:formamidopyrimidine-DNA glycosylase